MNEKRLKLSANGRRSKSASSLLDITPADKRYLAHYNINYRKRCSSVIDIWSLQPQPHLQPRAALRGPVSPASSRAGTKDDVPVRVTTTPPASEAGSSAQKPGSPKPGAVPKHWGEVVINPRKGKSQQLDDNARDVFGVLKVT